MVGDRLAIDGFFEDLADFEKIIHCRPAGPAGFEVRFKDRAQVPGNGLAFDPLEQRFEFRTIHDLRFCLL